ncbi:hypothetical protein [Cytobacillus massiliigabonensis]|uniref:hypothetical protein n=1 Tax=Cytobacillus massiliigabonensis TaxID=1871011 RepID=UPI000C82A81C|nr:hypothetical protein [Cytobacillus massiliigabonensis]
MKTKFLSKMIPLCILIMMLGFQLLPVSHALALEKQSILSELNSNNITVSVSMDDDNWFDYITGWFDSVSEDFRDTGEKIKKKFESIKNSISSLFSSVDDGVDTFSSDEGNEDQKADEINEAIDKTTEELNRGLNGNEENPNDKDNGSNGNENIINISDANMYQLGKHFNKHGRNMGYTSKKDYNLAAYHFAKTNQVNPKATIFEGVWNGPGQLNGTVQRAIIYEGKTVIVDKKTGQLIDFYQGSELRGLIHLKEIK